MSGPVCAGKTNCKYGDDQCRARCVLVRQDTTRMMTNVGPVCAGKTNYKYDDDQCRARCVLVRRVTSRMMTNFGPGVCW